MKTSKQTESKRFTRDQVRSIIESTELRAESCASLYRFDPDEFVRETKVKFTIVDHPAGQVEMGAAQIFLINGDLARYQYDWNLFYVFDVHSQDLCDIYEAFFTDDDEWIDEVRDCGICNYNILYIDYIYLKPEYRGYGIGRILAKGLVEEFAKWGEIVVTRPVPAELVEEDGAQIIACQPEDETVTPKLAAMCKSLGFIRLDRTNIFFLPLTADYPTVSDLLKKMFPEHKKHVKGRS